MAKLIKANGAEYVVRPARYKTFKMEEIRRLCKGYVRKIELQYGQVMFVNEFGYLYDGMRFNKRASYIAGEDVYGNVVICSKHEI
jgi:hypothetical protein|nr:MAG TPA: protein of unknown function (DUF3846) [Caudoviricetes sp.]